jgi:hypothetical protein
MPVAVFVGYVMPQVSEFTGYGDGGVNIRRLFNRAEVCLAFTHLLEHRISATCESRRSSHVGITANDWLERIDPIDVNIPARLGLTAAAEALVLWTSTYMPASLHGAGYIAHDLLYI